MSRVPSDRTLALAGVAQAGTLVNQLATRGRADATALELSLESVLRIDADLAADVFSGPGGVALGLRSLAAQLYDAAPGMPRDFAVIRLIMRILALERRFANAPALQTTIRETIERLNHASSPPDGGLVAPLGELYSETLAKLPPRILVGGDPRQLARDDVVQSIRACLLAGVRSAVLWRQLGGRPSDLAWRYRHIALDIRDWQRLF